jgi:transcriptional regulator with XRE-family HTH domain
MSTQIDLAALRKKLQMTRATLAEEAGVDVSTICRWEKNGVPSRGPARAFLERLAASVATAPQPEALAAAG